MSSELTAKSEIDRVSVSSEKVNIKSKIETHAIGDSIIEKLPSASNSRDNLCEISEESSHPSCTSFKKLCRAWKTRAEHGSNMSLQNHKKDLDVKAEDLTKRLKTTDNDDEPDDATKSLSLCVMMESRPLLLTDSSEESIPNGSGTYHQRFLSPDEISGAFTIFKLCDENNDGFLDLSEMKLALEKLSVPQTHLAAKELMAETVGESIQKLSFCKFLLTYAATLENRKTISKSKNCCQLDKVPSEDAINVSVVGVSGARQFFEAKIARQNTEKNLNPLSNL